MGFPKYREDDLDRRIENRAAILDEYQPSFTHLDWSAPGDYSQESSDDTFEENILPLVDPPALTVRDRIILRISSMKLQSGAGHFIREVLEDTAYWSPAHFEELARMSPQASAQLNVLLVRAYHDDPSEPEPPFRAVAVSQRSVLVEVRKRRSEVLHLRHPSFW